MQVPSGTKQIDFALEVARGRIGGMMSVNKFGRAVNGVQTTVTDIWDRADSTPTQQIWVAPTQARVHQLTSTSADDTGGGTGAKTVQVNYLPNWETKEVNTTVTMGGTADVALPSLVMINRMQVVTKGATNVNVGVITATADVDNSVSAQINASEGQTQMAIYGVPSIQTIYMGRFYVSMNRATGANAGIDMAVMYNPEPNVELTNFIHKHTEGQIRDGNSARSVQYWTPKVFKGPGILKMVGVATTSDVDVSAGFDLIIIDD